jgi:glucosamine--fructose-6-phosphate aminotransferase (isomerizing)
MQESRVQEDEIVVWREIASQAQTVAITGRKIQEASPELAQRLRGHANIRFLGCGSSYHAALLAAQVFNRIVDRGEASSIICSDFIIYPECYLRHFSKEDLFILISRTGRTTEVLIAEEILRKLGLSRLSVTTFPDSDLALKATSSIILSEAQEQSVTATRSVTSTTVALLALVFLANGGPSFPAQLLEAHAGFFRSFQEYCKVMSRIVNTHDLRKFVFLGSGSFYGLAKEAELKVKEMSQTEAEAKQPLEFRHGYKSLLDERTLVVLFPTSEGLEYEWSSMSQLHRQGAKLLVICGPDEANRFEGLADFLIAPDARLTEQARLVYYQLFGQLAGFYQARKKGIDPSNPRNHEYCVTF